MAKAPRKEANPGGGVVVHQHFHYHGTAKPPAGPKRPPAQAMRKADVGGDAKKAARPSRKAD